jgi:cell division protein FtsL
MEKVYKIEARVTKEEKEKIKKIAEEKGMSVTNLILNSVENHISVNIDTTDYRELVIQIRRIGTNINSLLRNIYYKEFFTDSDIESIKQHLKILENHILDEKKRLDEIKIGIENLTPSKAKRILEKNNEQVPLYMICADVVEHINNLLLDFVEMLRENEFDEIYIPY